MDFELVEEFELPGETLAVQLLSWGILYCTTEGPYVYDYETQEVRPLGISSQ